LDGPVAVGKSSVGSVLAKRLSYVFFDTGMMYRTFTWKALKSGVSPEDEDMLCRLASMTKFNFVTYKEECFFVLIDGEDVSHELLSPEIEKWVSIVSKTAGVRHVMVGEQRKLAQRGKVIMAGRDIGTVVLPWARLKIFLTASTEERARRRCKELLERGRNVSYEVVFADLKKRDETDIHRAISPLKPAGDAMVIDTELLNLEQVVDKICALVVELNG